MESSMEVKIIRIRLPNPYFEKDNNAYLIDSGGVALIDTGIDTPEAFAALQRALAHHGYRIQQIETIFLTHKHLDHFGLARRIQEISGASVHIHRADHEDVAHFDERFEHVNSLYAEKMALWGLPPELIEALGFRAKFAQLGRSVPAESLEDGQSIRLGSEEIRVVHTPGHTLGSACFLFAGALFTGDHLLPDYTPNIGATEIAQEGMLPRYLDSLRKIREYSHLRILPGHGEEIRDLAERVDIILTHHAEREKRIISILSDGKPRTVYQIAVELFGTLKDHHALLGAGEVQAHLEVLEGQRRVARLEGHRYMLQPAAGQDDDHLQEPDQKTQ
jgi:glyoxylase-like metal-dependent hydrolase (beta-lactamase superfamily II)